nr:hypothetical protein [Tanacetum cinerariifolium]GFC14600.1 hypothetical protein [Tanacetum cinerariifolium]
EITFWYLVKVTDTSSAQARKGKDIQGIPWDRLNITRESYRRTRLEQYRNYENIPLSGDAVDKNCKQKQKGFTQTQISTLAVKDDFLVAGGFQGELACKRLDKKGVSFCTRTTYDENAITNAVEIYDSLR